MRQGFLEGVELVCVCMGPLGPGKRLRTHGFPLKRGPDAEVHLGWEMDSPLRVWGSLGLLPVRGMCYELGRVVQAWASMSVCGHLLQEAPSEISPLSTSPAPQWQKPLSA